MPQPVDDLRPDAKAPVTDSDDDDDDGDDVQRWEPLHIPAVSTLHDLQGQGQRGHTSGTPPTAISRRKAGTTLPKRSSTIACVAS